MDNIIFGKKTNKKQTSKYKGACFIDNYGKLNIIFGQSKYYGLPEYCCKWTTFSIDIKGNIKFDTWSSQYSFRQFKRPKIGKPETYFMKDVRVKYKEKK